MTRLTNFVKHNAIAFVALFVALGGSSYAAVAIPRNSIGTRQLRRAAVTASKIRPGAITPAKLAASSFGGHILDLVEIENNGVVEMSDPRGVTTEAWTLTSDGGTVVFPHRIPTDCFPLVSAASAIADNSLRPPLVGAGLSGNSEVEVGLSGPAPVTLAIVCDQ